MFALVYDRLSDSHFMIGLLVAIASMATILTVAMPVLSPDPLDKRMRSVSTERERIRAREREKLAKTVSKGSLRQEAKPFMAKIVEQFSLSKWLGTETAKLQLSQAGFRGQQAEVAFLFFRLVMPAAALVLAGLYVFVIGQLDYSFSVKLGATIAAAYLGMKLPEIYLSNIITKRKLSIRKAFPDTLDLLLICVESGMSIEHAFRRVSQEIGLQSVAMAEELGLTTAELSFLPERRVAYDNLAARTGLEQVRSVVTVLTQAERYGTPLGTALRVVSQESRDQRMMDAEKKAASLPPKLTVPMIIFFLPVLFCVIGTPAGIQIAASQVGN